MVAALLVVVVALAVYLIITKKPHEKE